mmetsp:Transcript_50847/g.120364  ORF Transcript_50847/g.120364 Transcript_50847/m.120364 type:complete len:213 (+) Transcript_50847:2-640(+)
MYSRPHAAARATLPFPSPHSARRLGLAEGGVREFLLGVAEAGAEVTDIVGEGVEVVFEGHVLENAHVVGHDALLVDERLDLEHVEEGEAALLVVDEHRARLLARLDALDEVAQRVRVRGRALDHVERVPEHLLLPEPAQHRPRVVDVHDLERPLCLRDHARLWRALHRLLQRHTRLHQAVALCRHRAQTLVKPEVQARRRPDVRVPCHAARR